MNAVDPTAVCRWCGQPIGLFPGDGTLTWVHTGPHGAFPCRDKLTGMCLPTMATPTIPPDSGTAVGRFRVEPMRPVSWTPPRAAPAPGRPYTRHATTAPPLPHSAGQPRHRRPPARVPRAVWPPDRRTGLRRSLFALLPARLRRRRSRAHSLARLAYALGTQPLG